jgi:hypothetical protein
MTINNETLETTIKLCELYASLLVEELDSDDLSHSHIRNIAENSNMGLAIPHEEIWNAYLQFRTLALDYYSPVDYSKLA